MIPKIIHCFWAGGPKTRLAEKCLASWRKFAPGWEIREWDLENLPDLSARSAFCAESIRLKRWAAVSDYVRMWALKEEGGVYFDFDVELLKGIDDLTGEEWFAEERHPFRNKEIAPGLGMGLKKGSKIATRMLELYDEQGFDPSVDMMAVITANLTTVLAQTECKPRIYPPDWFAPIDPVGKLQLTGNTRAIHWYAMSWASPQRKFARWLSWHGCHGLVNALVTAKRNLIK